MNSNNVGALVTSDMSTIYETVTNSILKEKLEHIGIKFNSVKLIMDFLNNRYQYTEVNSNVSDITKNKNIGVYQGSSLAGILFSNLYYGHEQYLT